MTHSLPGVFCLRNCVVCNLDKLVECVHVVHGEVCENLAVDVNARHLQAMDELGVVGAAVRNIAAITKRGAA